MPTAENLPSDSVKAFNFPSKSEKIDSSVPSRTPSRSRQNAPMVGIVIMAVGQQLSLTAEQLQGQYQLRVSQVRDRHSSVDAGVAVAQDGHRESVVCDGTVLHPRQNRRRPRRRWHPSEVHLP